MVTHTIPGHDERASLVGEGVPHEVATERADELSARLRASGAALLWAPVRIASCLTPKDPALWLFGGCGGARFEGNARHLFQWVATHRPDLRPLWCTDDDELLAELRARELPCVATYSKEGTKLAMRASVVVSSHGVCEDLHRYAIAGGTRVARLGDAVYLLREGADASAPERPRGWRRVAHAALDVVGWALGSDRDRFDLLTVSSESQQSHARSALAARRDALVVTGLAKNDLMLQRSMVGHPHARRVLVALSGHGLVQEGKSIDPFAGFDPAAADRALGACGAELFVWADAALRPSDESRAQVARSERVHLFECGDLYHHLDSFDALVTDASPVFADYLLLDRPIVFLGEHAARRGADFYYDYEWLRCGPSARTWEEVLEALREALAAPEAFAERRARTRGVFHAHQDGRNCERVVAAIEARLRERR